jgi:hypothetical protein
MITTVYLNDPTSITVAATPRRRDASIELAACAAMERAARFIEQQTLESLRQWALQIKTNFAPNGICPPAQDLRNFCDMLNGEIQRLLGHEYRDAVQACVLLISIRYGDEAGAWLIAELDRLRKEHCGQYRSSR